MALHFTWKPEWQAVKRVLPLIEEKLEPFRARPHWAKLFTMPHARLRSSYAKMSDYQAMLAQYATSRHLEVY
jgi:xylitol oxidase